MLTAPPARRMRVTGSTWRGRLRPKPFSLRDWRRACAPCCGAGARNQRRPARPCIAVAPSVADSTRFGLGGGEPVRWTRREFELLKFLVENKNECSRGPAARTVWGYDRVIETRSVDVHVGRLGESSVPSDVRLKPWWGWGIASSSDLSPRRPAAVPGSRSQSQTSASCDRHDASRVANALDDRLSCRSGRPRLRTSRISNRRV